MNPVKVRTAKPEDAAAIEALYKVLVPGDKNIKVEPRRLADLEADPNHRLLVLEVDGLVCGTAMLTFSLDAMYGFQPFGTIENIIVSPSHHGKGLGKMLMSAIEDEARNAKCTKLMLLSSVSRSEAHAFFSAIGFDDQKKRGFIKYLNRARPLPSVSP
jgi:N-acetylglutamate synthase-like GNAT family acetyltransferase